jgi:glucose/arabinose dehydrogenase
VPLLVLALAACTGDDDDATPAATTTPTATEAPADTPSAPATATEPAATPTSSGDLASASIALVDAFPSLPELERPVELVELPDRGLFVVALQDGRVLSWPSGGEPGEAGVQSVIDLREQVSREGNEEGLLGMAFAPQDGDTVYLYYSVLGGERRTRLSRMAVTGEGDALRFDPATEDVLLEVPQPYANHNGGKLVFGPDGYLYLGLGDGGSGGDPHGNGQNTGTLLGSLLRLDVSGSAPGMYDIPSDNPLVDTTDARPEIYAWGLRNPWRFSFDPETGNLWAGDVGQGNIEEIDRIQAGGNYGWNIMEGSICFRAAECDQTALTLPVTDYDHSQGDCSVTGGVVYRGEAIPALQGVYLYGDFCSGRIRAFTASSAEDGQADDVTTLIDAGPPTSAFAVGADGEVYVLAFDGRIYRIVAGE